MLSESEHAQLTSMARSRSIPAALALRARIVLAPLQRASPTAESPSAWAPPERRLASGAVASSSGASMACTTSIALASRAPSTTSGWPI